MATKTSNSTPHVRLNLARGLSLVAVLAPLAYLAGRYATSFPLTGPWYYLASGVLALALGALIALPVGIYFGSLALQSPPAASDRPAHPDYHRQQDGILAQVRNELKENQALFNARKGDVGFLTRISYITSFWEAAKASGQLFVLQDPKLLNTIASAYYWVNQANRLESLAYESKYTPTVIIDNQNATTHLIAEARLLDGPLEMALQAAIDAINAQIAADTQPQTAGTPGSPAADQPTFASATKTT